MKRVLSSNDRVAPLRAIGLAAGIVAAMACLSRPVAAQESVTLKRVFTAGETDRYTTIIKFEQNAMEAVLVTTEVTREVKDDGTAVVATTVDSIVLRGRGSEVPFPGGSGQVLLSTYDKSGKPVKHETVGGGGDVGMLLNVARPSVFLDKPLKVGETIKDEVPVGPDKSRKAVVAVTLLGIDKKSADTPEDCLRFKVVTERVVPGPNGDIKSTSEVMVRLGKDNGKLVSAEGKMDGIPMPGGGSTKLSYTVTRTPAKK
ncbi:MAG: hypothetical protein GX446_11630 [Chthonomonadales bacterium]|nr:hypothetical protein [Chthonomonadales bacterium]